MKRVIYCIDCNKYKRKSPETFLCKKCFKAYIKHLQTKHGSKVSKSAEHTKWKKVAEENGISGQLFNQRVAKKMDYEIAATKLPNKQKRVSQYNLDGIYITTYRSVLETSKKTGVNKTSISNCCNQINKTAGGYIFRFEEDVNDKAI